MTKAQALQKFHEARAKLERFIRGGAWSSVATATSEVAKWANILATFESQEETA